MISLRESDVTMTKRAQIEQSEHFSCRLEDAYTSDGETDSECVDEIVSS